MLWPIIFVTIVSTLIGGCDDFRHDFSHWCQGCPLPIYHPYSLPTAPESLIANLQMSYQAREIEHYAELLAPEFKFKFQPADANEIGTPFWTHDQDSTGTRALLTTTVVSDIRIQLTHGSRDSSVDIAPPVDSLKIRIVATDLQVDQMDGTTWVVDDQQDLYFRKGKPSLGEDANRWFVYEWDDLPSVRSPGLPGETTTWGKIKSMYAN